MRPRDATVSQFTKYLVVGGLNALLTGSIYAVGLYMLRMHYLFALICAFAVGVVFTYVLNFVWVFRPETRLVFRLRFVKYLVSTMSTFSINLLLLYFLVDTLGSDPLVAQLLIMFLIIAANFVLAKRWSLRRYENSH